MVNVIVTAGAHEREFFNRLADMVNVFIPLVRVWKNEIIATSDSAGMLIADHESFKSISPQPRIIVFGGKNNHDISHLMDERTVAVANSCMPEQLDYISAIKLPAITCGLYAKDTITLSSIEHDRAVINLQRSLTCFNGESAEPQEFPVCFDAPVDGYLLMAYGSILILTGNAKQLACNAKRLADSV